MKLSVIEVNFRNDCMGSINDCFGKENKDEIHTSLFFWEAKRVYFGTSQKLRLKGRRI